MTNSPERPQPQTLYGLIDTIIFDIDGTLLYDASWLRLTGGLGASVSDHQTLFERFSQGEIPYIEAKNTLIKMWQATGNANRVFMRKLFDSWTLRPGVEEVMNKLRNHYRLCLMSGTVDLYVESIAERLQIEHWYANTPLTWDEKGNLLDMHYNRHQAERKFAQFQEFSAQYGLDLRRCAAVGNGDSDLVLFQKLPYGIAVPDIDGVIDAELARYAYAAIRELPELITIFG